MQLFNSTFNLFFVML